VFCSRALDKGRKHFLVADEMYEEALELAKKADTERETLIADGVDLESSLKPFHGVPISLKDHVSYKGTLLTNGVGSTSTVRCQSTTIIVEQMLANGAIPFVKSNLPPLSTGFRADSPNWGKALNPWDVTRGPGGSSGGEGGLICSGCSPCGFGTDTGGSLRSPANSCGISSFLPTPERLS